MSSPWPSVRLGSRLRILNGYAYSSKQFNTEGIGIPLVRIRDINTGFSGTYFSGEYDEKYLVHDGDLLIGMDGDFKAAIWSNGVALLNQRVCKLFDFHELDKIYIRFAIDEVLTAIQRTTSAATVKHLSSKQIENIEIPIPPLEEQKRVIAKLVEALGVVDELQANTARSLEELDALRTSIFANTIGGPWPRSSLQAVAEIEFGTRVTRKRDGGSAYSVYGGGGETFRTNSYNRDSCYIVSRFAMSEQCVRFVDGKFFLNDSGLSVSTLRPEELSQSFLDRYLLANSKKIYEMGRGAAQKNLDMGLFRNMQVVLPTLDEQQRIVTMLDELEFEIDRQRVILLQRSSEAKKLRSSILTAAFNGEL